MLAFWEEVLCDGETSNNNRIPLWLIQAKIGMAMMAHGHRLSFRLDNRLKLREFSSPLLRWCLASVYFQISEADPRTRSYQTSVIVSEGCIDFSPPNCISSRGGEGHLFNFHQSSTWENNTANVTSNIYPIGVGKALGYHGKAELGFDDVTLGWKGAGGPTLKNQTVAGFASNDSYLGFFGISPRASNFTSMANPIPSYMQNLRQNSMIPSLSWAYTAGNQYRESLSSKEVTSILLNL